MQSQIITWYVLIAGMRDFGLGSSWVVDSTAAGRIGTLVGWILVAKGSGAGTAGGWKQGRHRDRFGRQIIVVFVAQHHRPVVVARFGQSTSFCFRQDHVTITRILAIRVNAAELKVRLTLRRRQVEEARPGCCSVVRDRFRLIVVIVVDIVERRRIDYVGRRCICLGIGDLRLDWTLVRVRCGLRLAGCWRRRLHVMQLILGSFCVARRVLVIRTLLIVKSYHLGLPWSCSVQDNSERQLMLNVPLLF